MSEQRAVLIMGPTASGKTELAIQLSGQFPCDIISVDSALVYRGMDIGTAKPSAEELCRAPHQLVDIREPADSYSAGDFVRDAQAAMQASFERGRVPLLVGGTMMYFRALTKGLATLPSADEKLRADIDAQAVIDGWPAMHAELAKVDPDMAARLHPQDAQRIQRALEVFRASGRPLSAWQRDSHRPSDAIDYIKIGLQVEPRKQLHQRIEQRLDAMIAAGFEAEVRQFHARADLTAQSPSMRAVGYRQFWQYLDGQHSQSEARDRALFATRQLAKRQLTWLRSEAEVFFVNPLEVDWIEAITVHLVKKLA